MSVKTDASVKFFIITIGLVVIAAVLRELQSILIPFVLAYFLYFVFAPFNNFLFEKKIPVIFIILLDVAIILFISVGISRLIYESMSQLGNDWQNYNTRLNTIVRETSLSLGIKDPFFRSFSLQKIFAKLDYKELAGSVFSSAVGLSGSTLLVIFFFAFIVSGHHAIYLAFKRRFASLLNKNDDESALIVENTTRINSIEETVNEITRQIQRYIITKIAVNIAAGITVGLFLFFMGVDFALLWGLLTFLLNFIPTIGSAVALVFPSLMALIQNGSFGYGFLIVGCIALIQTLYFNFLEPILIGKSLGLNPIIILLSVLIWGYVWGIVGMLLAVPLTAIIKIIISNSKNENLRFLVNLMGQD